MHILYPQGILGGQSRRGRHRKAAMRRERLLIRLETTNGRQIERSWHSLGQEAKRSRSSKHTVIVAYSTGEPFQ